ncbi:MAG: hypothetical protein V1751_01380, partial [Pseudomonadota bacterium]
MFFVVIVITLLLVPTEDAVSSVMKMPRPLPDIVKAYKSVNLPAGRIGMLDSGVQLKQGDYITILAKGAINVWPKYGGNLYLYGPRKLLVYRLGEKDFARPYKGPELIWVGENGRLFLGYRGSKLDVLGDPQRPEYSYYADDIGAFDIDIIVWKTNDSTLIVKIFEEASLARPKDETLRETVQEFRKRQEVLAALKEKTKEVEGI